MYSNNLTNNLTTHSTQHNNNNTHNTHNNTTTQQHNTELKRNHYTPPVYEVALSQEEVGVYVQQLKVLPYVQRRRLVVVIHTNKNKWEQMRQT